MTVDKVSADKLTLNAMSVDEMSVYEMTVDKWQMSRNSLAFYSICKFKKNYLEVILNILSSI